MPPYNPKFAQQQQKLAQRYSPSYTPPKPQSWEDAYDVNKRVIAKNSAAQIAGKQTAAQTTANLRKAGIKNMQGNVGGPGLITGPMLDEAGAWAGIGIKPSIIAKALWAGVHHPIRTEVKGYAPNTPKPLPVWGGRIEEPILGAKYVMRPLGRNNTLKDKLHVLNRARGEVKNFLGPEADLPRNQQRESLVKYYDQHRFLDKLHNDVAKVDVESILRKPPWEMTRAEMVAHPYTVFHNSNSRPGLGQISSGIHAGTLQAANERKYLHAPGTKIHPVWLFPKGRRAIGEGRDPGIPEDPSNIFAETSPGARRAPGRPINPARDSGTGTPQSGAIRSLWAQHFEGFPADRQPPFTYQDNPAAVKHFFDSIHDTHIRPLSEAPQDMSVANYQNAVKHKDLFPYENNAEDPGSISYEAHNPTVMKTHKQMIVEAALAGHEIPKRVLRDYPGIQRQIARYQKQGYAGNLLRNVYKKNPARETRPGAFMGPANKLQDYQNLAKRIDQALADTERRHEGGLVPNYSDHSIPSGGMDAPISALSQPEYQQAHHYIKNGNFHSYNEAKTWLHNKWLDGAYTTKQHNDLQKMAHNYLGHNPGGEVFGHTPDPNFAIPKGQPDIFADLHDAQHNVGVNPFADEEKVTVNTVPTDPHTDDLHFWHQELATGNYAHDPELALNMAKHTEITGHPASIEEMAKKWMGMPRNIWEDLSDSMKVKHIKDFLRTELKKHGIDADHKYNWNALQMK